MPDWIIKIFSSINIFPFIGNHFKSILVLITLFGWSIFIFPLTLLQFLHIYEFRQKYLEIIGVITVISSFALVFLFFYELALYVYQKYISIPRLFKALTPIELSYLQKYIEKNSQTATFSLYDGVVAGLAKKGIIYKPDSLANTIGEQDFNIFPLFYKFLVDQQKERRKNDKKI